MSRTQDQLEQTVTFLQVCKQMYTVPPLLFLMRKAQGVAYCVSFNFATANLECKTLLTDLSTQEALAPTLHSQAPAPVLVQNVHRVSGHCWILSPPSSRVSIILFCSEKHFMSLW